MEAISHYEEGTGQPLILLHGFCETQEIWQPVKSALAKKFRLLCPDLPGFGNSRLPHGAFSIENIAEQLWWWTEKNNLAEPIVIGHSLGGYVTLAMAAQKPNSLKGVGLFHSTALPDSVEKKENRNKVIDFVSRNGVDPFLDTFVPGLFYNKKHPAMSQVDAICRQTQKDTLLGYTAAMRDRPDQMLLLEKWEKPFLVIAGEKDSILPVDSLRNQAERLKKGHFKALEDVGHMGMFESPRETMEAITLFGEACHAPFF